MSPLLLGMVLLVGGGFAVWLGITGHPPVETLGALLQGRPIPKSAP